MGDRLGIPSAVNIPFFDFWFDFTLVFEAFALELDPLSLLTVRNAGYDPLRPVCAP